MKTAGVREIKNNLSAYLRDVRRGAVIRISDRGEVVAELRPPAAPAGPEAEYERLVAEGKIIPPSHAFSAALVPTPRTRAKFQAGFVNELIDADRGEPR